MAEAFRPNLRVAQWQQPGVRQIAFVCTAVALWLFVLTLLFPAAAVGAFRVWRASPTFNHCFLIAPIAFFLIWRRRVSLAGFTPAPDGRAAIAILALAPVWLLTNVAGILEAQQFVVITMLQAALFGTLGIVYYRKLAAPFLYLYFLVPSGAWLVPALQSFTAHFSVAGLHVLGIPVFSNGAVIEIPAGSFAVAEACAGLRFLVAAVAFGAFFAVMTYRSWMRRAAFVALSIVVPIIANGFRALGLIAAAQWIGNPASALADHILYGWLFFSIVLVLLVAAGQFFSDQKEQDAAGSENHGSFTGAPFRRSSIVPALACLLAAGIGPAVASLLPAPQLAVLNPASPVVRPPWQRVKTSDDWAPVVIKPARAYLRTFTDGSRRLDLYVAIFRGRGGNIARSQDRAADEGAWTFNSERTARLDVHGETIPVRFSSWLGGNKKRVVWSFYLVDGHVAAAAWRAKWDALRGYLSGARCLSAYVAVSEEPGERTVSGTDASRLLEATQDLGSYLCGSNRTVRRSAGK